MTVLSVVTDGDSADSGDGADGGDGGDDDAGRALRTRARSTRPGALQRCHPNTMQGRVWAAVTVAIDRCGRTSWAF